MRFQDWGGWCVISAASLNSLTFVEYQQFMPELGLFKNKNKTKGHCQIKIKAILYKTHKAAPQGPSWGCNSTSWNIYRHLDQNTYIFISFLLKEWIRSVPLRSSPSALFSTLQTVKPFVHCINHCKLFGHPLLALANWISLAKKRENGILSIYFSHNQI